MKTSTKQFISFIIGLNLISLGSVQIFKPDNLVLNVIGWIGFIAGAIIMGRLSNKPRNLDEILAEKNKAELLRWIPVTEQRPPSIDETPETRGFFLLLCHNPQRDAIGHYRLHMWFGSVPIDATHWAKIPSLQNVKISE